MLLTLYHGTGHKFDRFKPNSFFADSYAIAAMYAAMKFWEDEFVRVIQVQVEVEHMVHIPACCLQLFQMKSGGLLDFQGTDRDIAQWLTHSGADVAVIYDLEDIGGSPTQYMVRDPSRIRFVNETVARDEGARIAYTACSWLGTQEMLDTEECPF